MSQLRVLLPDQMCTDRSFRYLVPAITSYVRGLTTTYYLLYKGRITHHARKLVSTAVHGRPLACSLLRGFLPDT